MSPESSDIKKRLKDKYKQTFQELFQSDKNSVFSRSYKYVNLAQRRNIVIGEMKYSERTFTCLTRKGKSEEFLHYFVTEKEFNVNKAPGEEPLAGRFIFSYNQENPPKLIIRAFAEESGKTYTDSTYYLLKKVFHSRSKEIKL